MELWKPIKNYEGLYEVSNFGRVRRIDSVVNSGLRFNATVVHKGRVLKQHEKRNGYFTVDLSKGNIVKTISVHRLVAEAFLPNVDGFNTINHKNCNKHDNRAENLEWCTPKMNSEHAKENGLYFNPIAKPIRCRQTHQVFKGSYKAAEWVNETKFGNSRQIRQMANKIRCACNGYQKSAYGFTWEFVDCSQGSSTNP